MSSHCLIEELFCMDRCHEEDRSKEIGEQSQRYKSEMRNKREKRIKRSGGRQSGESKFTFTFMKFHVLRAVSNTLFSCGKFAE
jgi:hypothetical protein